jgi:hypothetical protein
MSKQQQVPLRPLIDIETVEFGKHYENGVYWSMYGDEQGRGLVCDSYLVTNLKNYATRGYFDRHDGYWLPHLGFYLGMYHGGVLSPATGKLRPEVHTLLAITTEDTLRGYHAGREWYFVETAPTPHERRITEHYIIERLRDSATEMHAYHDHDSTWYYCVGCILGELSGQLFPMTVHEQDEWVPLIQRILAATSKPKRLNS